MVSSTRFFDPVNTKNCWQVFFELILKILPFYFGIREQYLNNIEEHRGGNMKRKEEPLPWIQTYQDLLLELRCKENPQHRIEAAELLLEQEDYPDRIAYLVNAAIYEPDEEVKDRVLRLLFDRFGNNLYQMIDVEKSDGIAIQDPWLTFCTDPAASSTKPDLVISQKTASYLPADYESLLKEIRCEESAQHRIEAAKKLVDFVNEPERIAHLANVILYDPDPEVRRQVKGLMFQLFGKELETILQVEGADGIPLETPWMIPCRMNKSHGNPPVIMPKPIPEESWNVSDDLEELHYALRDPLEVKNRLAAARALAKNHSPENLTMLAKAVLFDPDDNVQQQAYQSLYEAAGDDKAEALLNEIGASSEDEEEWLLIPDAFDEYQNSLEPKEDASPFGINKADQVRGLVNLFTGEKDPQKRITILQALDQFKDVNVNQSIARVGLFDADMRVREYAKSLLGARLGDHLDSFLVHIYETASTYTPDPDDDQADLTGQERDFDPYSTRLNAQPSVIQEGPNLMPFIILAGLVIIGLVMVLIFR